MLERGPRSETGGPGLLGAQRSYNLKDTLGLECKLKVCMCLAEKENQKQVICF